MKYSVKINQDGESTYLTFGNRASWSYRTARKHAKEFLVNYGGDITATIEDQFGEAKATLA